jgi:hypothetical protein
MTPRGWHDSSLDELACLSPLTPHSARADAVRLRCRTELTRRAVRERRREARARSVARLCIPALLGAVPVFYAAVLFVTMLRLEGWVR